MKLLALSLTLLLVASRLPAATPAEDLARVYSGKLDHAEDALGQDWRTGPEDVWTLSSFRYELRGKLEIELGESVVVFGKHGSKKKGYSVVWAAVFPLDASEVPHEAIVANNPGHGDHVTSLFLRFHPARVGDLFPKATVTGQGDAKWLMWARRLYAAKINACYQVENMPFVPPADCLVFDCETVEGKRRMYMLDEKKKKANYEAYFAERTVPAPPARAVGSSEALAAFDEVWEAFDREYAMFVVKPHVEWSELKEVYRAIAERAETNYEVAGAIALLLAELEDLHVYVKVEGTWVPGFNRMRMLNANWRATKSKLSGLKDMSKTKGVTWGKAPGDVGYVAVWNLSNGGLSDAFDEALEDLGDTKALIVDLRFNGGGDETLGRRLAGRFLDRERVYSLSQYRNGEKHDQLGPKHERTFEPRGPWRYEAPVCVLIGQKTMSSAESLALMFAQCPQVTTMGDRTAGSSANPRRLTIESLGIEVNLPRWLDLDPDGEPIDYVGIPPMEPVEASTLQDFGDEDPVFEAALKFLKKKKGRKPGRR